MRDNPACAGLGFPIRRSPDQSLLDGSPRLIAACYVLHRSSKSRHPPCALITAFHTYPRNSRSLRRRGFFGLPVADQVIPKDRSAYRFTYTFLSLSATPTISARNTTSAHRPYCQSSLCAETRIIPAESLCVSEQRKNHWENPSSRVASRILANSLRLSRSGSSSDNPSQSATRRLRKKSLGRPLLQFILSKIW